MLRIGLNTYHVTDRFGRYESGELDPLCLSNSVEKIRDLGFKHVEVLADVAGQHPDLLSPEILKRMRELAVREGLSYSTHLAYKYVDISSLNEKIRRASVAELLEGIELSTALGAEAMVFHPVGAELKGLDSPLYPASRKVKDLILQDVLAQTERSVRTLLDRADSRRLCLENLLFIDFEHFLPLVEKYDLSICLDIGHLLLRSGNPLDFIARHGSRIAVIHLHDVAPAALPGAEARLVDHVSLGAGRLDVDALIGSLTARGYGGAVVLEYLTESSALEAVRYLRERFASTYAGPPGDSDTPRRK